MNEILINPITFILGVISIFLTIGLFIKGRFRIEPRLYFDNQTEISKISDSNRKIRVLYNEDEVSKVTTTRIWFWNKGRKPIRKEDIPSTEKIAITISDTEVPDILDYGIIKQSRQSSNFKLNKSGDSIFIEFDNIDYNEGVVFEIQHTGTDKALVHMDGYILGPKKKINIYTVRDDLPKRLTEKGKLKSYRFVYFIFFLIAVLLVMWILSTLSSEVEFILENESPGEQIERLSNTHNIHPDIVIAIREEILRSYEYAMKEFGIFPNILLITLIGWIMLKFYRKKIYPKSLKI